MSCSNQNNTKCHSTCKFNITNFGVDDVSTITIDGSDRTQLNWTQISVPELLKIPVQKPDIEQLNQIYVEANLTSAKLIETPFAYNVYDRVATALEIASVETVVDLVEALNIQPIIDAVNAILAIPGLPAIPAVAALQAALNAVTSAFTTVTNALTAVTNILLSPCVIASLLVAALQALLAAVNILLGTLNALIAAANLLVTATQNIPVVGALVEAAVAVLLTAINLVVTSVETIISSLEDLITLFGTTQYFAIIPNAEDTCLTGRKLIVEGTLKQRVVYTALEPAQSVHSACFEVPFSAYIIAYASFEGLEFVKNITVVVNPETCETAVISGFPYDPANPPVVNLCEDFTVSATVEDIFSTYLDKRTVFKNITLFLLARPITPCS